MRQPDGYVGILAVDILFPENGSLKDKRQYLRSLKAGLARKLGASVSEIGYHDLWQRSRILLSLCGSSFKDIERALDLAVAFLEARDYTLTLAHREIIKVESDNVNGW